MSLGVGLRVLRCEASAVAADTRARGASVAPRGQSPTTALPADQPTSRWESARREHEGIRPPRDPPRAGERQSPQARSSSSRCCSAQAAALGWLYMLDSHDEGDLWLASRDAAR